MSLLIRVFYQQGDLPFIFEAYGHITKEDFEEIEEEMKRSLVDDPGSMLKYGDGEYYYRMFYFDGQYGPGGRVEIRPHWEFDEIAFKGAALKVKCGLSLVGKAPLVKSGRSSVQLREPAQRHQKNKKGR